MTIEIHRNFTMADRYRYDFKLCTYEKGWAQVDTSQDASYYGTWTNPLTFEICNYCEGDVTLTQCSTAEEYVSEIRKTADWNKERDYWLGIDPGLSLLKDKFEELGLSDLLH